jgi:glycine betaine/proline transport system ATP-binding protein
MRAEAAAPIISCAGLWKIYGADAAGFMRRHAGTPALSAIKEEGYVAAVRDVSLAAFPGEILVVMGLSGSGKSTLVRCLARLTDASAGDIFFDGQDLRAASAAKLIELRRHRMGMVFQHFALLPHRTALANVAFPLEVQGMPRVECDARAREMLELVGLKGREEYYPRELSGGQQQRVGIARSLAVKPDLWFLDEPFSALDPLIRREMQDEFLRLQALLKKTIVFITHDFDEAIRLADRIAIMFEGRIDQLDTPEALILNPATDYVREFTKNAARDKILSVAAIMESAEFADANAAKINSGDKLATAAGAILAADRPLAAVDGDGLIVGAVRREKLIEALFGESAGAKTR